MTLSTPPFSSDAADQERWKRAQDRLYVACQCVGWGIFLGVQSLFVTVFAEHSDVERGWFLNLCGLLRVVTLGLLLTHYSRRFIGRWGWKNLGWLALVPRMALLSLGLSVVWSGVGFAFHYLVEGGPISKDYSVGLMFLVSTINGTIVFLSWYFAYFIYHLFDRFNRSEIERLRLANVVKEAELRALKSQVNPHFIFNSLNSVRALIDEDPARSRQAVTQLANLLRYSLQSGQRETVSFEDELAVVNDYLALEQVRHEERLRLRLDVAPETLNLPVPTMVLQTLVENAIKYGISARPEGGEITISARIEDEALCIIVTNPGQLSFAATTDRSHRSTRLGLRNAEARLQLLFGDRARVSLRQFAPDVVAADIVVPLRSADIARIVPPVAPPRRPVSV